MEAIKESHFRRCKLVMTLFTHAVKLSSFIFDNVFYRQIDVVSMG